MTRDVNAHFPDAAMRLAWWIRGAVVRRLQHAIMLSGCFFLIACLQSCSESCKRMSFESLVKADRIVVEVPGEQSPRVINDPAVVTKILKFADARKDKWEVPLLDTPVAPLRLSFYEGAKGISYLAVGRTFLEAPGCDYVVSRKITPAERQEIAAILGVPDGSIR